jgi:hypothetical protein
LSKLIVLFIAGFIGLSLRYIISGEFEIDQLLSLLLFPAGSMLVFFILKWQYNKDRDFQPNQSKNKMVTRLGDRVSTTTKQMYRDKVHIGSYHRYYNKWWKRIIADVFDDQGRWYLNLIFTLHSGDRVVIKGENDNKIIGNIAWVIYKNDKKVGTISTDYSVKNAIKFLESLHLQYGNNTYHFKSYSLRSKTEIYYDNYVIATGERAEGAVYELTIDPALTHDWEMLFMVYILFNYNFSQ